jgi:uncharacterized protein YciW
MGNGLAVRLPRTLVKDKGPVRATMSRSWRPATSASRSPRMTDQFATVKIEATLELIKSKVDRVRALTVATHDRAVTIARDHGFSFYDALIVAAALEAGCDVRRPRTCSTAKGSTG